jgi:hypothetical protein
MMKDLTPACSVVLNSDEKLASLYCGYLNEIRVRLEFVRSVCKGSLSVGTESHDYEVVAVNLRKVLELIAFGSLTANKAAYSAMHAGIEKKWRAKALLDDLDKIHPDFYPKPLLRPAVTEGEPRRLHFDFQSTGFLTRDEFIELYDLCSKVIHTRNPFAAVVTVDFRIAVIEWVARIEKLLSFHLFRLSGMPQIWIGELAALGDGKSHVYIASPN